MIPALRRHKGQVVLVTTGFRTFEAKILSWTSGRNAKVWLIVDDRDITILISQITNVEPL